MSRYPDSFVDASLLNHRDNSAVLAIRDAYKANTLFDRSVQAELNRIVNGVAADPDAVPPVAFVAPDPRVDHFLSVAIHMTNMQDDLPTRLSVIKQMSSYEDRGNSDPNKIPATEALTLRFAGSVLGMGRTYIRLYRFFTSIPTTFPDPAAYAREMRDHVREMTDLEYDYAQDTLLTATPFKQSLVEALVELHTALDAITDVIIGLEAVPSTNGLGSFLSGPHIENVIACLSLLAEHTVICEVDSYERAIAEIDAMAFATEIAAMTEDSIGKAIMQENGGETVQAVLAAQREAFYARFIVPIPADTPDDGSVYNDDPGSDDLCS